MSRQAKLFDDTDLLPLFAGVAPRVEEPAPFVKTEVQATLPFRCGFCRDSGWAVSPTQGYVRCACNPNPPSRISKE
jgi:hypothetical protein